MIVKSNNKPQISREIDAMICWLNHIPAKPGAKYILIHTTNNLRAMITELIYKIDINNFSRITDNKDLNMNDIARVKIKLTKPLLKDSYRDNRITGSLILIDESTNETVAAAMII